MSGGSYGCVELRELELDGVSGVRRGRDGGVDGGESSGSVLLCTVAELLVQSVGLVEVFLVVLWGTCLCFCCLFINLWFVVGFGLCVFLVWW